MNQLHILIAGGVTIAVALAAIGIFNQTYAQDNATMMMGNMTGDNATTMAGNETTMMDNATGQISGKGGR